MNHAIEPIHPGEILSEELMVPAGISQNALARALHVSPSLVNGLVLGRRAITAETALRLGRFSGTTPDLWLSLQAGYDLAVRREAMAAELEGIEPMGATQAHDPRGPHVDPLRVGNAPS